MVDPKDTDRGEGQAEGEYKADGFGIGVLNDGNLNVVTEEEAFQRGQLRDAMEGDDGEDDADDLSDLSDIEEIFGV